MLMAEYFGVRQRGLDRDCYDLALDAEPGQSARGAGTSFGDRLRGVPSPGLIMPASERRRSHPAPVSE
jgi:hypothetical protein